MENGIKMLSKNDLYNIQHEIKINDELDNNKKKIMTEFNTNIASLNNELNNMMVRT